MDVIVLIGAGQIGQAIARRVGFGKHVLLADMRHDYANAAAEILGNAGYEVSVATVDASSREAVHALVKTATGLGDVTGLIHAAGVSPAQASSAMILKVDLCGAALVHRPRWGGRRHGIVVWASPSPARRRAKQRRWPRHPWKSCPALPSFSPT